MQVQVTDLIIAETTTGIISIFKRKEETTRIPMKKNFKKGIGTRIDKKTIYKDYLYGLKAIYVVSDYIICRHKPMSIKKWSKEDTNCEINDSTIISYSEMREKMIVENNLPSPINPEETTSEEIMEVLKFAITSNFQIRKTLLFYGIDIPIEEIQNIEILELTKKSISYRNKKTNEIISSNLLGRVYKKYDTSYSVGLTISNEEGSFFLEQFNSIEFFKTLKEAGENALESRKNIETKLFSRAYADIDTKYGNFCLHIEEGYTDYNYGPYRQISLYYGNHEQVIDKVLNEFDFNNFCLFRWKFMNQGQFN